MPNEQKTQLFRGVARVVVDSSQGGGKHGHGFFERNAVLLAIGRGLPLIPRKGEVAITILRHAGSVQRPGRSSKEITSMFATFVT